MYADVIVDISFEKLDRIFQYGIPEHLKQQIKIGSQVEIPFGNGNRKIKGYIISFSETTQYPIEKIKELIGVVKNSTTIETRMIQLAWWLKETYGSTMNQALKTVVPVKKKIKGKEERYIKLKISKEAAEQQKKEWEKRNKAKAKLLAILIEEERVSYEVLTKEQHIAPATIRGVQEVGAIEIVSESIYRNPSVYQKEEVDYHFVLTSDQKRIADEFLTDYKNGVRKTYLLHGVTGSGKTEVYMEIIANVISMGKQAIVLIPEIALTYQTVHRFYKRFGNKVSILNSRMSQGERFDQFERAKKGEISIMIGPRSALFTPFSELGLIIIDEEHESSYKSENVPKYHARETAIELAKLTGSSVLLGSATPSIEAFYRAIQGEYKLFELKNRVNERAMPSVFVVDLREELKNGNKSMFSNQLKQLIWDRLNKKQQVLLFMNKRGYAGFVSCLSCGNPIRCPHCDVSLTAHNDGTLQCHYCGYQIPLPKSCPFCGSPYIAAFGTGTQKVEAAVKREFPTARVLRMDSDTTAGKDGHERILSVFSRREADILIGTQMIVKGHDFPFVTLVGVLAADMSLYANDYRASERTFQLLTQAAGRAGRGHLAGEVVIQTYSPQHYSIETAATQDYRKFYEKEILYRKLLGYPPVGDLLAILISSKDLEACEKMAELLKDTAEKYCVEYRILIIGPADATVSKIQDFYRKILYLKEGKSKSGNQLKKIKDILEVKTEQAQMEADVQVQFDFNPMNTY